MNSLAHYLTLGFAMMLIVEGLIYALFPSTIKSMLLLLQDARPESLRWGGIGAAILGLAMAYLLML